MLADHNDLSRRDALWHTISNLKLGTYFRVQTPLDTRASGNWARVVQAEPLNGVLGLQDSKPVALKIMRAGHLRNQRVFEMFLTEARILGSFGKDVSAASLLGTGIVHEPTSATEPAQIEIFPDLEAFAKATLTCVDTNWHPFLVLSLVPYKQTILHQLRQLHNPYNDTRNVILPLWKAINITVEALRLLEKCHQQHLFYIDHKPEHVIWHNNHLLFLDWNGGEWLDQNHRGSFPQGRRREDVANFIGYVAYSLFTGVHIDGEPVRSLPRGTHQPPPPVQLQEGQLLPFRNAADRLDNRLKLILSKPFWPPPFCYQSAQEMIDDLEEYLKDWMIPVLYSRLEGITAEVDAAQQRLKVARQSMELLRKVAKFQMYQGKSIKKEIDYINEHLIRFENQQMLLEEED